MFDAMIHLQVLYDGENIRQISLTSNKNQDKLIFNNF